HSCPLPTSLVARLSFEKPTMRSRSARIAVPASSGLAGSPGGGTKECGARWPTITAGSVPGPLGAIRPNHGPFVLRRGRAAGPSSCASSGDTTASDTVIESASERIIDLLLQNKALHYATAQAFALRTGARVSWERTSLKSRNRGRWTLIAPRRRCRLRCVSHLF